jgi:hypothetical protein
MSNIDDVVCGANLTGAVGLVLYIDGSDGEKAKVAGNQGNATLVGICVQGGADDAVAKVCSSGYCTGIAGAAIEPFDYVTSNADGKLKPAAATGDYVVGRYIPKLENGAYRDAASGDKIRIDVLPDKTRVLA